MLSGKHHKWEMFTFKIFLWRRWTTKIKRTNICLQETFHAFNFRRFPQPTKYFNTKILHEKIPKLRCVHTRLGIKVTKQFLVRFLKIKTFVGQFCDIKFASHKLIGYFVTIPSLNQQSTVLRHNWIHVVIALKVLNWF